MTARTKLQYETLRTLSGGLVESIGGLHPAGEKTIAELLSAGWIEQAPYGASGSRMGYRITATGEETLKAGRPPKAPRRPSRLTTLKPRLGTLAPRFGSPDGAKGRR